MVTKTVTVHHRSALSSPAAIVAALNEARLDASLTFPRKQATGTRSWLPPWHILAAVGLLIISLVHYLSGPTGVAWLAQLKWVALGAVALPLPGIVLKALGALRHGVLDIHLLITIAAAGAIALGDYTEAGTVVVLFSVADFLESRCTGQARDAISAVLALKPETAVLADSGKEVPAVEIGIGTVVLVRPGDNSPVDGVVVAGTSAFDESVLTGESVPVVKHAGDAVRAGTLNAGSMPLEVRATVAAEDTFVAGMARLVEQATSRQSPSEAAVAKFAKFYTPIVVVGCLLLAFVPWANPNTDRRHWVYLALEVLVIACPCALVLSTPVTIVSALARAAQVGVLIKGGLVLETLQSVEVASFDKTGTLTKGAFLISDFLVHAASNKDGHDHHHDHPSSNGLVRTSLPEMEVLRLLGSLERGSSHPLAAAIVGRAAARGATCDATVEACEVVPGFGIKGMVDGHTVCAGSAEFLTVEGLKAGCLAALEADRAQLEGRGLTTCYLCIDGRYAASIGAKDAIRPEAVEAVATLRALGVTPAMLTGDNAAVASAVAAAAGIRPENVHAQLLPQGKLEIVASYHSREGTGTVHGTAWYRRVLGSFWGGSSHRKVCHIGDGVNDAPALAAADVGIAMGVAGAAAALEAGDVALFTNDLRIVPALHRLALATRNKIYFNITLSVVTKVAVLVLAALNKFTLWGAVLVDVGTALLVTINGLTLLRWDFGLEGVPAVCVGAAAAAASKTGCGAHCGGCCDGELKPNGKAITPHAHSSHSGKGCCGGGEHGHHDHDHQGELLGRNSHAVHAEGKACCGEAAEEATPEMSCGHNHDHDHSHHHKGHSHKGNGGWEAEAGGHPHSHGEKKGGCCGHDHHGHDGHKHEHKHGHAKDGAGKGGACCGGGGHGHKAHGHKHSHE